MDIHTNIPLKNYVTMRLGGNARFMVNASTDEELVAACQNAKANSVPFFVLGGGSNVIVHDERYEGIVIRNRIPGFSVIEDASNTVKLKLGAGEEWDSVVQRSTEMGLSGIEAMSSIPGTVGAAPVQNIGAYGQEIADTVVELEAYDSETDTIVTLQNADCRFSYRNSIFRGEAYGRYAILNVTLQLFRASPQPPFYQALQTYFDEHAITLYSPSVIREAVQAIRADKLPDPTKRPNAGSFFKNAIIDEWQYTELLEEWPDMPAYKLDGKQVKIPTGWLIEKCGLKGALLHGMRVHDKNALVLINESALSFKDLALARSEIAGSVRDTFRISIEQEPLEL